MLQNSQINLWSSNFLPVGLHFGARYEGYLITAAFFVILAVVVFAFRNVLFLNPMLRGFTEAAFEKEESLNNLKNDKDAAE